jgi:hypothetical protein
MRRGKPMARVAAKRAQKFPKTFLVRPLPPLLFPKPARRPGTKHSRRPRERGRMKFYSQLWCLLRDLANNGNLQPHLVDAGLACRGPIEVAHLGDRGATGTGGWRRAPDRATAPLCRKHHRAIDGKVGGKAPWYVALGRHGQQELRAKLVQFAGFYWDGLNDEGRAAWERRAAAV